MAPPKFYIQIGREFFCEFPKGTLLMGKNPSNHGWWSKSQKEATPVSLKKARIYIDAWAEEKAKAVLAN